MRKSERFWAISCDEKCHFYGMSHYVQHYVPKIWVKPHRLDYKCHKWTPLIFKSPVLKSGEGPVEPPFVNFRFTTAFSHCTGVNIASPHNIMYIITTKDGKEQHQFFPSQTDVSGQSGHKCLNTILFLSHSYIFPTISYLITTYMQNLLQTCRKGCLYIVN